ncbi:hypothetical protein Tco_0780325 [Tanacetum coccineum]
MPTHRLSIIHSVDYSSSDDSSSSSSSSSSSETSLDSSADALSDSASSHSSSDHSLPAPPSSATDLKGCSKDSLEPYVPREARLGVDFEDESSESSRDRRVDIRGTVEVRVDRVTHLVVVDGIPEPAQEGAVEVIKSVQRYQRYNIVTTRQQSADILERIRELEQDNRRLRDMMDVASQRVARSQRRELRVRREMRQVRHFKFYNRMRIARLEACARRHLGYRALGARNTARRLEPLMRGGGGQMEEMEMGEMEMEVMEMVIGMEEEMAITSEDLCLLESTHIKTS